jgi:hypothetical protein
VRLGNIESAIDILRHRFKLSLELESPRMAFDRYVATFSLRVVWS